MMGRRRHASHDDLPRSRQAPGRGPHPGARARATPAPLLTYAPGSARRRRGRLMDLGPHLDAIRGDLEALAGSDEAVGAALARLGRPLEASLQLRLLDALGEASSELAEQLPAGHVEVR